MFFLLVFIKGKWEGHAVKLGLGWVLFSLFLLFCCMESETGNLIILNCVFEVFLS